MKRLILILSIMLASLATAQESKPVLPAFVKAKCDGKLSSVVLSSFKDTLTASKEYRLTATLNDDGRNNKLLYIQMSCVERNNIVAVATAYGLAKCVGPNECHMALDGSSMSPMLCDPSGEVECGAELFKAFVLYLSTAKPILKVD
ncbi:MAG: hypothetical protein WBV46_10360 [Terriglobales bacterium]|jgi:hypothetical protein